MLKGFKRLNIRAFLVASCLITLDGYADTWDPDPAIAIPNSSTSSSPSVFSSCDSAGNFLATWLNNSNAFPYYSIYNKTTSVWGTPLSIFTQAGASGSMVFSAFDSSTGNFLATWKNGLDRTPNNGPFFSLYNGNSWTTPGPIAGINNAIDTNVYCSSDSNGHFLATWCPSPSSLPYYAIYTEGTPGSWGFSFSLSSGAFGDVVSSCDSSTGYFLVTWRSSGSPNEGSYSVGNLTPPPLWTVPTKIPGANPNGPLFSSSDNNGKFLVTWYDSTSNTAAYSIYTQSSAEWSDPVSITGSTPTGSVTSSFDSLTGDFLITWQDSTNNTPYYSIYNPSASPEYTVPSQVAPQGSIASAADIFSSCDQSSGTFLTTFVSSTTPYYTFYSGSLPPPPPSPVQAPGNFRGKQKVNNFGVVSERYNSLSWESSIGAEAYRLYRNGALIATLGESSTWYDDHNQPKTTQIYTLTAVGAGGSVASTTISVGK
jgi:hypothetical protein